MVNFGYKWGHSSRFGSNLGWKWWVLFAYINSQLTTVVCLPIYSYMFLRIPTFKAHKKRREKTWTEPPKFPTCAHYALDPTLLRTNIGKSDHQPISSKQMAGVPVYLQQSPKSYYKHYQTTATGNNHGSTPPNPTPFCHRQFNQSSQWYIITQWQRHSIIQRSHYTLQHYTYTEVEIQEYESNVETCLLM